MEYCVPFDTLANWPGHSLKEGTVQGWENRCNREVPTAADHTSL